MFSSKKKSSILLPIKRTPTPITPTDDAFHGSTHHIAAEWWYFDAIFTNNYSMHLGLRSFSKKHRGMLAPQIEIYKNSEFIGEETTRILFKDVHLSKTEPFITHHENTIMSFNNEKYKQTDHWQYQVSLFLEHYGINLAFDGTTPGWKIETDKESWTVALPKANVHGTLIIDGKTIPVSGMGYHDHNWNYTMLTVMNYGQGWYWGKIASQRYNIVWAKIVKSSQYEILAVINTIDNKFYTIDPSNIELTVNETTKVGRYKTPSHFTLRIHEIIEHTLIDVDVEMQAKDIHYNNIIVAPYFRYHVTSKGTISVGSEKETVNATQIMEFLRFC